MAKKSTKDTMEKSVKKTTSSVANSSTVAKSDDGTIQITFTINYDTLEEKRKLVLEELAGEVEIPGFRKGKAPIAKVKEHVKEDTVVQRTLNKILPKLLGEVITKEKLRPALYPRFELLSMKENEPWQIRATTCELPEVTLGDYKKEITGSAKAGAIWTPGKGDPTTESKEKKELTRAEKETKVITLLLEKVKVKIPKLLADEEVNNRLSQLLARIEKLGLDIDSYLASIGKNAQTIRNEYEIQAKQSIALDIILTEIAKEEKITISDKQISDAIDATKADPNVQSDTDRDQQKALIQSILKRRAALDTLIDLL